VFSFISPASPNPILSSLRQFTSDSQVSAHAYEAATPQQRTPAVMTTVVPFKFICERNVFSQAECWFNRSRATLRSSVYRLSCAKKAPDG